MRILLVEDEKKLAVSLKKALEAESYAVDIYFDGQEGYEAGVIEDYDLILLDIGLPQMDGITISKKLREEGITTPILMLTAQDTTKDKIIGLDSGADDYLVKPFDFEELLARIRSLLRRKDSKETIYKVGSLSLDPAAHILKRGEVEIDLTLKEYALIEYLIRNKNKIVSKSQIIEHVWDNEIDPFSNVVDVYIGYIRNKIDKNFPKEEPLVYTVKGLGYRLGQNEYL